MYLELTWTGQIEYWPIELWTESACARNPAPTFPEKWLKNWATPLQKFPGTYFDVHLKKHSFCARFFRRCTPHPPTGKGGLVRGASADRKPQPAHFFGTPATPFFSQNSITTVYILRKHVDLLTQHRIFLFPLCLSFSRLAATLTADEVAVSGGPHQHKIRAFLKPLDCAVWPPLATKPARKRAEVKAGKGKERKAPGWGT